MKLIMMRIQPGKKIDNAGFQQNTAAPASTWRLNYLFKYVKSRYFMVPVFLRIFFQRQIFQEGSIRLAFTRNRSLISACLRWTSHPWF